MKYNCSDFCCAFSLPWESGSVSKALPAAYWEQRCYKENITLQWTHCTKQYLASLPATFSPGCFPFPIRENILVLHTGFLQLQLAYFLECMHLKFKICPQHALRPLRNACLWIYTALKNEVCSSVIYGYEMFWKPFRHCFLSSSPF